MKSNLITPGLSRDQREPTVGGTMEVSTGEFRALRDQVEAIETEVADLRRAVLWTTELRDVIEARAYREGRESVLGRPAGPGRCALVTCAQSETGPRERASVRRRDDRQVSPRRPSRRPEA